MMSHRIFNTLAVISALLLACTGLLWVWSFWADPHNHSLSLSESLHIGVYDGRVAFFSDKYGPYRGSIIALTSPERPVECIFAERRGFGDTAGIYYRYFRWADSGAVLWTLSVSLLYPLAVFAVLPTVWTWRWWRDKTWASRRQTMRDVDSIIAEIHRLLPDVQWRQLQVSHPGADDDGLWFFRLPSGTNEVQIESSKGICPFLVEHNATNERYTGRTVSEVVAKVIQWLQIDILQDIEAVMTFLRTEEGGRERPVFSGYRPQFYYDGEDWDAQHTYIGVEQVKPGDTVTAQLKFLSPRYHVGRIAVGMEFLIREGKRTVATGRVTKTLHLEENATVDAKRTG